MEFATDGTVCTGGVSPLTQASPPPCEMRTLVTLLFQWLLMLHSYHLLCFVLPSSVFRPPGPGHKGANPATSAPSAAGLGQCLRFT